MKNNTAMNFLNHLAHLFPLSDERCERTGQSPTDGLLWHIGGGFGGWGGKMMLEDEVKIDYDEGETCWKFPDGSMVICSDDPSDFEDTEDTFVRYAGTVNDQMCAPWARDFRAGCGFTAEGEGLFRAGVYVPIGSVTPKVANRFSIPVTPIPVVENVEVVTTTSLAVDHALAVEYNKLRQSDYDKVVQTMPIPSAGSGESVPIFEAGNLYRLPEGSEYWGRGEMKHGDVSPSHSAVAGKTIYFASVECYRAWVLRRFW